MKATDSKGSRLEVDFIIDITGSMGTQIDGVKRMVKSFCSEERDGIGIHITTYTENSSGCYVCHSKPGLTSSELVDYVEKIRLGQPPDFPGVSASGGDGPENVVAAVASMLNRFTPDQNVLAFIITDASPHDISSGVSSEARQESNWLKKNGFESTDVFVVLNEVIESLNVTFVPILYSGMHTHNWYIQSAALTEGVVLSPIANEADTLAKGLVSLMHVLQGVSRTRSVDIDSVQAASVACAGFKVLDLDPSTFEAITADAGQIMITNKYALMAGVEKAILGLAHTACDRFSGKRASKRCRTVDPEIIAASVKVLVYSMLKIVKGDDSLLRQLQENVNTLVESLKDTPAQVKLLTSWMDDLPKVALESTSVDSTVQPVQCAVTLESALEYLSGLEQVPRTEEDVTAWMDIVLQLAMCRLVNVVFPKDSLGNVDFTDSWSANVKYVSLSTVLSASAAVQIRDKITCVYVDPLSREECSSAMILSHPNDPVLSQFYTALSSLPSLQGLVQGYLLSGGFKVFPSLVPGLQASCLLFFLRSLNPGNAFSPAQWEVIRCILWSLFTSRVKPAADTVRELKAGNYVDPADNIGKIVAGVLVCINGNPDLEKKRIFKILFEEMSAEAVSFVDKLRMRHIEKMKKDGKENEPVPEFGLVSDADLVRCVIPDEASKDYDPLTSFHLSEKILFENEPLPESWRKSASEILSKCAAFGKLSYQFDHACKLALVDVKESDVNKAFASVDSSLLISEAEKLEIFVDSVFFQKRTGRYNLTEDKKWVRKAPEQMPNIDALCRVYINGEYKSKISEWRATREKHAEQLMIPRVNEISGSFNECVKALSEIKQEILGKSYTLNRNLALEMLAAISDKSKLPSLGKAVLIGTWSSEPCSCLRRSVEAIEAIFAHCPSDLADIMSEISKREMCNRTVGCNRHGHTQSNPFPGSTGWTQKYHDQRISDRPGSASRSLMCKEFTEFYEQACETMKTEGFSELRKSLAKRLIERLGNSLYTEKARTIFNVIVASTEFFDNPANKEKIEYYISRLSDSKFKATRRFYLLVKP